jgi:hypothetical protein
LSAARDNHTRNAFGGDHISLPGVTPDQLSQSNFIFEISNSSATPAL